MGDYDQIAFEQIQTCDTEEFTVSVLFNINVVIYTWNIL